MKKLVVALPFVALVAVCGLMGDGPERETLPAGVADLEIGRPVTSGNLTIFPILSRSPRMTDRFITLDEGLANGTIEVVEVGADGEAVQLPNDIPNIDDAAPSDAASNAPDRETSLVPQYQDPDEAEIASEIDQTPTISDTPADPALFESVEESEVGQTEENASNEEVAQDEADLIQQNDLDEEPFGGGEIEGRLQDVFGGGPEVNRLLVKNTSGKPLYLMPGEVVIGGQQDRTIAEPTVLASSEEWQSIDAFCVESGRWEDRDGAVTASLLTTVQDGEIDVEVAEELAVEANAGKFVASNIALNSVVRKVVLAGDGQDEVWNKVGQQNDAAGVADLTLSMAFTANYGSEKVAARLHDYEGDLHEAILEQPRVVGVVVAINGRVQASDVFESTPLFRKLWPKLLKSYALDAYSQSAQSAGDERVATGPVDGRKARTFLRKAFAGNGRATGRGQGIELHEKSDDGIVSFENVYNPQSTIGAPVSGIEGLGGLGGAVQQSAFE